MIFKRKMYNKLLVWKRQTAGAKALLIEGAQRIGKSTLVEEFAKKNEYRSYLLIDFNKVNDSVISAFNNYMKDLHAKNLYVKEGVVYLPAYMTFCL